MGQIITIGAQYSYLVPVYDAVITPFWTDEMAICVLSQTVACEYRVRSTSYQTPLNCTQYQSIISLATATLI